MQDVLGLDWKYFTNGDLEFYDAVNFMKGGLTYADRQIAQQHGGTALIDESEDYRCIVRITMPQPKIAPR